MTKERSNTGAFRGHSYSNHCVSEVRRKPEVTDPPVVAGVTRSHDLPNMGARNKLEPSRIGVCILNH